MESFVGIIGLDDAGKIVALIVSVFTAFKAFKEVSSKKTEKLRADYEFAEKFLSENKWVELHDYLLERGYWALLSIGTLIDPPICGVLDPLKTVFFVLKQSDYFLLCAPRPV